MKKLILFISLITFPLFAQVQDTTKAYDYPYSLPIWGQKAADRGIKLQLPYGLNVNYVYNQMELEINQFSMTVGDDPTSELNQKILQYVNMETLNFKKTEAISHGANYRADVWVFPFWNFYALYSTSSGSTEVSLQPRWYDEDGNLVLSLPEFGSTVEFTANTVGLGSSFVYGFGDYFVNADVNYTQSYSGILDEPAQFMVASARIGERISFRNGMKLSPYVGAMWRGFVESDGNFGSISFEEVFPELGNRILPEIDNRIIANNDKIAALNPNKPLEKAEIVKLEKKNEALYLIEGTIEDVMVADVNYDIQKDIVNNWSVQFGFNFEMNENWTLRGEYGVGTGNDFILTGLQYRFAFK